MIRYFLYDINSVFIKEMKDYYKDKSMIVMTIVQPLMWLILMGFGMGGMLNNNPYINKMLDGAPNYITYLFPGILIMTALYGGLYGGVTLLNDIRFGYIVRMNTSPIDRRAIILGKMESSLFQTLLQLLVLVLISVFIGVEYNKGIFPIIVSILIAGIFCITMTGVSLILSMIFKTHNAIYSLVSFITLPLMFTSNAIFPNTNIPVWLEVITKLNPITYAVNAIRNLLQCKFDKMFFVSCIILISLCILSLLFAWKKFCKKFGKG